MDALSENPLILTTEDLHGFGQRVFVLLLMNAFSALLTVLSYSAPRPMNFEAIGGLIGLDAMMLAVSLLVTLVLPRGTWEIDLYRITYQPLRGPARELAWASVSRIQWGVHAVLEGKGVRIRLCWDSFPKRSAEAAKKLVEDRLAGRFDLSPIRRAEGSVEPALSWVFLRRILSLSAVPVLITVVVFAVASYVAYRIPGRPGSLILQVWLCTFMGLGLIVVGVVALREGRKNRERHPDLPWRRRKSADRDWLEP